MLLKEILNSEKYKKINAEINFNGTLNNGIVFIYPSWSGDQRFLNILLDLYKKENSTLPIYIYDIDDESGRKFEIEFNVLNHGKGEVYLILNGKISFAIKSHSKNPVVEIQNLLTCCKNNAL